MNLIDIKDLFVENFDDIELVASSNVFVGRINGFDVQISNVSRNFKVSNVLHILFDKNIKREEFEVIRCIGFKYIYDYINVDVVSIRLDELESKKENERNEFFSKLNNLFCCFADLGFHPCHKCHICGEEITEHKTLCFRQSQVFGGVIGLAHVDCVNAIMNEDKEAILKNENNTKAIPLAIVLCCVFAILFGLLISYLSSYKNAYFILIMYIVTPIESLIYSLVKAPNNKTQFPIVFCSVIFSYVCFVGFTMIFTKCFSGLEIDVILILLGLSLFALAIGSITTIKSILANLNEKKLEKYNK